MYYDQTSSSEEPLSISQVNTQPSEMVKTNETPLSEYGQNRIETLESNFEHEIFNQSLANFNSSRIYDKLIDDMNSLGEIQPEEDGLLSFINFRRIYTLV